MWLLFANNLLHPSQPSAAITEKSTWASLLIGSNFQIREEVTRGQDADAPSPEQELVAARWPRSLPVHRGSMAPCHCEDMWGQWFGRDRACVPRAPTLLSSTPASAVPSY